MLYSTSIQKNDVILTFLKNFAESRSVSESISVPTINMNFDIDDLILRNNSALSYSYDKHFENIFSKWTLRKPMTIEDDVYYLFGDMRDLTVEEKEFEAKMIASKTTLTGVSFFD